MTWAGTFEGAFLSSQTRQCEPRVAVRHDDIADMMSQASVWLCSGQHVRCGCLQWPGDLRVHLDGNRVLMCVVNRHCFQLLCFNGRRNPQAAKVGGAISPA